MTEKKKYSVIKLTSQSTNGDYFGAYESNNEDSKKGYTVFLSTSKDEKTYCECMGFVHGKECYHLKEARSLSQKLQLGFPQKRSGE